MLGSDATPASSAKMSRPAARSTTIRTGWNVGERLLSPSTHIPPGLCCTAMYGPLAHDQSQPVDASKTTPCTLARFEVTSPQIPSPLVVVRHTCAPSTNQA